MIAICGIPIAALNWNAILREAIAPTASAFVVFLVVFVWFARRPEHREGAARVATPSPPLPQLIRSLIGIVVAGYAVFALIVGAFYLVLLKEPGNFVLSGSKTRFALGTAHP